MEQPQELLQIYRDAIQCNACFEDRRLTRGYIKVAQMRPIGLKYSASLVKILVLMINPGKGCSDENHRQGEKQIRAFADGQVSIDEIFHSQRVDFHRWGQGGRFLSFYEGLGLDFDEVALANVAWCSEMRDKHPAWMLHQCFQRHTSSLLRALKPDVILLSGSELRGFETVAREASPGARILLTPHFAHREGLKFEEGQGRLIRSELLATRSEKALERKKRKK